MKLQTENSQIRRRSSSSIIYLFIPFLNYLFFLFQARGAYIAIKNYYQFNKKLPNFARTALIAVKYSIYGSVGSILLFWLLSILDWNTFGTVAIYYLGLLSDAISGFIGLESSTYFFGNIPQRLVAPKISWSTISAAYSYILFTYFVFGMIGSFLAVYNIKSDLKRNLMDY